MRKQVHFFSRRLPVTRSSGEKRSCVNSRSNFRPVFKLHWNRLPTLSDAGYEKRGETADFSRYTCRFQWSKSTRNLKEEIKRYSPLIEPPSFQWKVKLPLTVVSSVSPFYGRPAINAKISERSMFNFVPGINCPWERMLSYLKIDNIFGIHTI